MADIRYALRLFAKNAGTTAVAVLSLAIAIGPNSALFSLIDHLLLRSNGAVPGVYRVLLSSGKRWQSTTYADYLDYRAESKVPAAIIAIYRDSAQLSLGGVRELVLLPTVSENYFSSLGVKAALGRVFAPEHDGRPTADAQVVISHSFWQRRMAGDPAVVGKTIVLNGRGFTVIGVAQPGFRGLEALLPHDLWIPLSAASALAPGKAAAMARRDYPITMVVLLPPGVPATRAEAELSGIAARLAKAYPATNKGTKVRLESDDRTKFGVLVGIIMSLVGLVLLTACANVAGILLAQGEARRREIAVRLALGVGRARLVRQLLVESALISVAAAVVGLLMGYWVIEPIAAIRPPMIVSLHYETGIDARVIGYTLLLALATTIGFGLAPALRATRPDLLAALRGEPARDRTRPLSLRAVLVIGQVAIAQFLLLGGGLLLRSYLEVEAIRPGFDMHRNLLFACVVWDGQGKRAGLAELAEAARVLPGVRRVSYSGNVPLSGNGGGKIPATVAGVTDEPLEVGRNRVGPGFCSIMGTRLLRGREFDAHDARTVAMVNETMARRLWGGPDAAMGRFFRVENAEAKVVGVVEDGKYDTLLEAPAPYVYLPAAPTSGGGYILVETAMNPREMAGTVRKGLLAVSPNLSVTTATLHQHLRLSLFAWETGAGLVSIIGLLGILLGGVGLYGIVSFAVNRRTHEIGVRMALGAQSHDVLGLVLRQALWLVAAGSVAGVIAALVVARIVSAVFYNVSPADPAAIAGSVVVVAAIALAASHVPARRALRVDPIAALREE